MLTIYDISNHQKGLDLSTLQSDGFVMKATEGTGFVDGYCDGFMEQCKKLNKLKGVYHFLRKGSGKSQAQFFLKNIKGYLNKDVVLFLDFEEYWITSTVSEKPSVQDCVDFVDEVVSQTGVIPVMYMNESDSNYYDWYPIIKRNCGLWVAKYSSQQPSVKQWSFYMMWQYTSNPLDKNWFYGDKNTWLAYSGGKKNVDVYYKDGSLFKAKQDVVIYSDTSWTNKTGQVVPKGSEFNISKINVSGNTTNATLLNGLGCVTLHKDYVEKIK